MALENIGSFLLAHARSFDSTVIICTCLGVPCSILLFAIVYRAAFHPLSKFPGPVAASITGWWRNKKYNDGNWHKDIVDLHRQYGHIVRIAPNELSIVDEHAMKMLYGHGHNAPKTNWYSVWDPPNTAPQLFSELEKNNHSFLRKRVSGAYSMSSVLKYETYIQSCLDLLQRRLREQADAGKTVNMSEWTNAFAFDVVGELAYGSDLGHLRTETDVGGLRKTIFQIFRMLSVLGHFPGQAAILNFPVLRWLSALFGQDVGFGDFQQWSEKQIQTRLDNPEESKRNDLLSHFCKMKDRDGNPVKFGEILIEAMNLM